MRGRACTRIYKHAFGGLACRVSLIPKNRAIAQCPAIPARLHIHTKPRFRANGGAPRAAASCFARARSRKRKYNAAKRRREDDDRNEDCAHVRDHRNVVGNWHGGRLRSHETRLMALAAPERYRNYIYETRNRNSRSISWRVGGNNLRRQ